MKVDAFQVVRDFEKALCEYTGAPYAVAVNSCTMALLLAVAWHFRTVHPRHRHEYNVAGWLNRTTISIPKRTYVSVPMSIIHAGGRPIFRNESWVGCYEISPVRVFDSARWFTRGMWTERRPLRADSFGPGAMVCCSFHVAKTLGDSQGGAILLDDPQADAWLRRARFDGRTEGVAPKDDRFDMLGWHCYMSPDVAARLVNRLSRLPAENAPLPNDDYPDLSQMEIFR